MALTWGHNGQIVIFPVQPIRGIWGTCLMDMLVSAGTIIGMSFGLFHAVYVYRYAFAEPPADSARSHVRSFYYALSTFVLWALFGTYVLVLWLVGAVFYVVFKAFR